MGFTAVAALTLLGDVASKAWVVSNLAKRHGGTRELVLSGDHLSLRLTHNLGGAWGLLESASQAVRLPFFMGVSAVAIIFIVSAYRKAAPERLSLRYGLPLLLGGAIGNAADRILRAGVVDFIDYRANWVLKLNELVSRFVSHWAVTDHWPTFNVADVAICIGVALLGIDMFVHGRSTDDKIVTPSLDTGSGK